MGKVKVAEDANKKTTLNKLRVGSTPGEKPRYNLRKYKNDQLAHTLKVLLSNDVVMDKLMSFLTLKDRKVMQLVNTDFDLAVKAHKPSWKLRRVVITNKNSDRIFRNPPSVPWRSARIDCLFPKNFKKLAVIWSNIEDLKIEYKNGPPRTSVAEKFMMNIYKELFPLTSDFFKKLTVPREVIYNGRKNNVPLTHFMKLISKLTVDVQSSYPLIKEGSLDVMEFEANEQSKLLYDNYDSDESDTHESLDQKESSVM